MHSSPGFRDPALDLVCIDDPFQPFRVPAVIQIDHVIYGEEFSSEISDKFDSLSGLSADVNEYRSFLMLFQFSILQIVRIYGFLEHREGNHITGRYGIAAVDDIAACFNDEISIYCNAMGSEFLEFGKPGLTFAKSHHELLHANQDAACGERSVMSGHKRIFVSDYSLHSLDLVETCLNVTVSQKRLADLGVCQFGNLVFRIVKSRSYYDRRTDNICLYA